MKKQKQIRSNWMFCICAAITASAGWFGLVNTKPVLAAESVGEEMVVNNDVSDTGENELSENALNTGGDENLGVYDFKDNKTTGTVTVTKVWDDDKTNEERAIPDIKISTSKPSKNPLGYTVTFHGNKDTGLVFDDGGDVNNVVYNSSGQIVDGTFKVPGGWTADAVSWFTDKALTNKVDVNEDGTVQMALSGDVDLWAKTKTVEIKGYNEENNWDDINEFNELIPDTVTEIIFTDEPKPEEADIIDVDADGDGGVVAWMENNDTVMKVSTQIKGMKVQAAKNSRYMFISNCSLTNIDFSMFDTSKVTNMYCMFCGCEGIKSLDLSSFDTSNVTNMYSMFNGAYYMTSLNLSSFNTSKVTDMSDMFNYCMHLESLDLSSFDTSNVTDMSGMFSSCNSMVNLDLSSFNTSNVKNMKCMFGFETTTMDEGSFDSFNIDLSSFDTSKVTNMEYMFGQTNVRSIRFGSQFNTSNVTSMKGMFHFSDIKSVDLSMFDTSKVEDMSEMFYYCSSLTSLDLTGLDTSNVLYMSSMFSCCSGLTALDLSPLDTQNVTDMSYMFYGCYRLTALDLSPLDTQNVTNMGDVFSGCSGLTTLDLSPLDTQKVTNMDGMFYNCSGLTSLTTGSNFKFVDTAYRLDGTWQNTAGETFNGNDGTANFPSNIADTYTKFSN